jgi:hypothetical protein
LWRIKGKKNIDHLFPIDLVRKIFKNYPQININKCLCLIMIHYLILGFSIFCVLKSTSGLNKI